jgi:predicted Zn-dependent protease
MRSAARAILPLLLVVPALEACAVGVNPVSGARRAYAYTWQQEIRIGREADREILEQFGVVADPVLARYVERVGEAVLEESHLRRPGALEEFRETAFTFRLLDTEIVNAFALPGGYVYVTRGLLAHLENEAQLAVVLGHEVAHVAARHSSKAALKQGLVMLGIAGAGAIGEELGSVASVLAAAGGLGAQLLMMRHSRDDERESDALGVEYASRAGYDAAQGAEFFTALRRMRVREAWYPSFLSTHPDPGRREQSVRELAARHASPGRPGVVRADAYLERIEGLVLGEDPRQGFLEDGAFHHPAGRFTFPVPRGWEMSREGREVQLAPPRGSVGVVFLPATRHATAAEAAAAFVSENTLGDVSTASPVIGGRRVERVDATARGGDETYRVTAVWIEDGGEVRRFLALSSPREAGSMEQALSWMLRGFRRMTDPDRLGVEPSRVEVVRIGRSARFGDLAGGRELPQGMDLEALAIMNGVAADDLVPAGRRLRLPR